MKVSIDLLPERSVRKEESFPVIPVIGIVFISLITIILLFNYFSLRHSVKDVNLILEEQVKLEQDLIETINERTTGITKYNYVQKYLTLNHFLTAIYRDTIETNLIIDSELPAEAIPLSYTYGSEGNVTITISFKSKGDVALYLNRLIHTDIVEKVDVQNIYIADDSGEYISLFTVKLITIVGETE